MPIRRLSTRCAGADLHHPYAPWTVLRSGDSKCCARVKVLRTVVEALEEKIKEVEKERNSSVSVRLLIRLMEVAGSLPGLNYRYG